MTTTTAPLLSSRKHKQKPLLAVFAVFAILDGTLLFANTRLYPGQVDRLFPLWAVISAVVAIVYSQSIDGAVRRLRIHLDLRQVLISLAVAVACGTTIVVLLRQLWMTRLVVPSGSMPMRFAFVLVIVLLVPISEEILFRGIFLDRLIHNRGAFLAILLSSVAAAVCHDAIVPALLEHFVIGTIYVLRGRSLSAALLTHITINTIALLPALGR